MLPLAPYTSVVCAAALVALPATSHADVARLRLVPALWPEHAVLTLSRQPRLELPARALTLAPPRLALSSPLPLASPLPLTPPLALEPSLSAYLPSTSAAPVVELDLRHLDTKNQEPGSPDLFAGLNLPAEVPPLLRYTHEDTDVALSISPGSPCTGACLKLAGSF